MPQRTSRLARLVTQILAEPIGRFDGAARRVKLICAALDLASTGTAATVSMSAVARRVGVSTATIYRDFSDRETMIDAALAWLVPVLTRFMTEAAAEPDPRTRLMAMLQAHGEVFDDPYLDGILRYHVSNLAESHSGRPEQARLGRQMVEAHWAEQVRRFSDEGLTGPVDTAAAIALLLGPIERRTVLARLLFSDDPDARPSLEETVVATTDAFLAWAARGS